MAFTLVRHLKRCSPKAWNLPALNARVTRSATGVHLPFWESGSGHYGNTLGQYNRAIADGCLELILPRLDTIPVPARNGVFTIADYGANDGYTSMTVLYEDQEKNDFNSLFMRLQEESSYVHDFTDVYTMATNTNFYKQVVPNETCDVIITSFATHWLEDPRFADCNERNYRWHVWWHRRQILDLQDSWRELMEKSVITQNRKRDNPAFQESTSPVVLAGLNMVYHDQVLADCVFKAMWREKRQRGELNV
ncbi:hypothetical protein BaRGS_00024225 [Batillaria attramentaria]|uniref:Uncharacterized protein n=1 Tax=Batillaria attramentaria TaxID=370345 RepID=A0ABD0KBK9_9CAEN